MANARSSGAAAGQLGSLYSLGAAGGLTDGQLLERFLTRDDPTAAEAAFSELVDRHGAMVLSVCRRELGNPHDAHDAFQATFLVLVNKAAAVRHWNTVGGWLVGIARRVSARARVEGARRRRHLEQLGVERTLREDDPSATTPIEAEPDYAPLFAEIDRLPERFRAPVVLHYLEGLSTEATAQRLGCARGTVLSRLSRARDRLRQRLEQRCVSPAVLIPIGDALSRWLTPEPVPSGLAQATIHAASSLGLAGAAIESVVPVAVARLSRRVARTLVLARVGVSASLILLAVMGVSIGLAATLKQQIPQRAPAGGAAMEKPGGKVEARTPGDEKDSTAGPLVIRGRVLDPDGKPVGGAEVLLGVPGPRMDGEVSRLGAAGSDGRFEVSIARASLEPKGGPGLGGPWMNPSIAAASPGLGPDWSMIDTAKPGGTLTLTLRRDDVPIEGRVISLEGRPIPGLSVRVAGIAEISPATIGKLRESGGKNPGLWVEMRNVHLPGEKGKFLPVKTGADGRFRVTGIGRDRVAFLIVEGGSIEQTFAMVSTTGDRDFRPVPLPSEGEINLKIQAPRFELSVAPGRAVEGTVRDRDTARPIAGAGLESWTEGGRLIKTDAQGRFRLAGQSRERENYLTITVEGQPYIKVVKPLMDRKVLDPDRLEITLKRGVWVEGTVVNRATGKPVKAVVTYYPFRDNPNVKDAPDASFLDNNLSDEVEFPTDARGHFRAVALPGGGILAVQVKEPGYVTARPLDSKQAGNVLHAADFNYYMYQYHAFAAIDAPAGETLAIPDIALTPGRTQHIQIVDPDGRPLPGARIVCLQVGLQRQSLTGDIIAGSEWTFIHAKPGKAEALIISHAARSLGATIDLKGDEPDPIRVVLKPCGMVTGRLVDEDGKPRPNMKLAINQRFTSGGSSTGTERWDAVKTGPDGRFRIKDLVPGLTYNVEVIKQKYERNYSLRAEGHLHKNQWSLKPGETIDWGDVQVKPYPR